MRKGNEDAGVVGEEQTKEAVAEVKCGGSGYDYQVLPLDKAGDAAVFTSTSRFNAHRVTPVTRGRRLQLLAWMIPRSIAESPEGHEAPISP